jgi:hypothetical protein
MEGKSEKDALQKGQVKWKGARPPGGGTSSVFE